METKRGHHCTKEEIKERIEFCLDLLRKVQLSDGRILHPSLITKMCAEKFGCSRRSVDKYLTRAGRIHGSERVKWKGLRTEWVSDVLETIIANPATSTKDCISAINVYSTINGLAAPTKTALTTVDGQDVNPIRTPEQDREQLMRILEGAKTEVG